RPLSTCRAEPACGPHAARAGTSVHVAPPSFEYSTSAVTPAGGLLTTLPTLNCTAEGTVSTTATPAALLLPLLVMVSAYVRSVPGASVPTGLTERDIVRLGRTTVSVSRPETLSAAAPRERAVKINVSV